MPLRYSKPLRRLLTDLTELQTCGMLDEPGSKEFLHKNRKAFRELQRLEGKQPLRRGPSDLTKSWARHFSSHQYSVSSVVDLLSNKERK